MVKKSKYTGNGIKLMNNESVIEYNREYGDEYTDLKQQYL